jgi:phage-related tail protein
MTQMTIDEAHHLIEQLKKQIRYWQYLFEEQQHISTGFRDIAVRYKEMLDQGKHQEIVDSN